MIDVCLGLVYLCLFSGLPLWTLLYVCLKFVFVCMAEM